MVRYNTIIATSGDRLTRATRDTTGRWSVEALLKGTRVNCFVADPHRPNVLFAGTQGAGVLCSQDWGLSWQRAGLPGQIVKSLAMSSEKRPVLYAGTGPPALYASRDGGQHWLELESFRRRRRRSWRTPTESEPYVLGLAISPTDPDVILAGVEAGAVLRSSDGGATWHGHLQATSRDCHALMFHATDGNWAYQGGGFWPAAVSRDGGQRWQQPKSGLGWKIYGWAVAADPADPSIWYVSAAPISTFPLIFRLPTAHWDGHAHAAIFRSTADGSWTKLNGGLPQPLNHMAYALITDPLSPGHLYAGLSNGFVWHTDDYGDSWTQLPLSLGRIARTMILLQRR